ncbi:MAG: hypothetical protein EZS28_056493, partial [Streblomastix strix]
MNDQTLGINARANELVNDIGSHVLPQASLRATAPPKGINKEDDLMQYMFGSHQEKEKEKQINPIYEQRQYQREKEVEGQILQQDNAQTQKGVEYFTNGLNWGTAPVNQYYSKTPYASKK